MAGHTSIPGQDRRRRRQGILRASGLQSVHVAPETGPRGDVLVLVFLRGGMDGLHVVPAHGDPHFRPNRPTLAPPEPGRPGGVVDLDGHFGLHPDLAPLSELFAAKELALVHASGSPDRTLSHFEAMQTAERGVSDGESVATGWLARHLNSAPSRSDSPMRAVAISDTLPKSLEGALGALAVNSIAEYRLRVPDHWGTGFTSLLTQLYGGGDDSLAAAGRNTLRLAHRLESLVASAYQPAGGATYPGGAVGDGLKEVARLIKADVGLEIAQVDLGGWDAHAVQSALVAPLMEQLGRGLRAFHADLGDRMRTVTVVAMSEFGRRVQENAGAGTDHGRGTVTLVLGGGIRGGRVYGRWPGLAPAQLDTDGNLRVTTDFRDILAEIVAQRLGNPRLSSVFPNHTARFLGLADPS